MADVIWLKKYENIFSLWTIFKLCHKIDVFTVKKFKVKLKNNQSIFIRMIFNHFHFYAVCTYNNASKQQYLLIVNTKCNAMTSVNI